MDVCKIFAWLLSLLQLLKFLAQPSQSNLDLPPVPPKNPKPLCRLPLSITSRPVKLKTSLVECNNLEKVLGVVFGDIYH